MLAMGLGAVGHETALEVVALDAALEPLTHAGALHVAEVALFEHGGHVQLHAGLVPVHRGNPELRQVPEGRDAALGQVAQLGLVQMLLLADAVPDLHGGVAVGIPSLHHGHHVAIRNGDHGDGDGHTLPGENLGHARLLSHKTDTGLQGVHAHAQCPATVSVAGGHAHRHGGSHEPGGARLHGGRGANATAGGGSGDRKLHNIAGTGGSESRHGEQQ
mmetsp:Transcript_43442/g.72401  ORF Transcript_43442/g.72401 Transcript_43442/m.72401 type:complete len:217 (-) Transcript_43442:82-732(-)